MSVAMATGFAAAAAEAARIAAYQEGVRTPEKRQAEARGDEERPQLDRTPLKAYPKRVLKREREATPNKDSRKRPLAATSPTAKRVAAGAAKDVQAVLKFHEELLKPFEELGVRKADACISAEALAADRYGDVLGMFRRLFTASGFDEQPAQRTRADDGREYTAVEINGSDPLFSRLDSKTARKMDMLRKRDPLGTTKEATIVALSLLSARREMCWVEGWDDEDPVRGYFAPALSSEGHRLRLTMVGPPSEPTPVSVMMTAMLPLAQALDGMDNDGPLRHMPAGSIAEETRAVADDKLEFALQRLEDMDTLGAEGTHSCERIPSCELQPDSRIKALLMSEEKVLVLEAYAALAPREVAVRDKWGSIIQGELRGLLEQASRNGVPVLFHLSGMNPHMLARKVYMRDAFAKWGLEVGYLRWRCGSSAPWGREQDCRERVCIALQIPTEHPAAATDAAIA